MLLFLLLLLVGISVSLSLNLTNIFLFDQKELLNYFPEQTINCVSSCHKTSQCRRILNVSYIVVLDTINGEGELVFYTVRNYGYMTVK